jgi:hypothetical protein
MIAICSRFKNRATSPHLADGDFMQQKFTEIFVSLLVQCGINHDDSCWNARGRKFVS